MGRAGAARRTGNPDAMSRSSRLLVLSLPKDAGMSGAWRRRPLLQKTPSLSVLDLDDPEVGVETALPGEIIVDF